VLKPGFTANLLVLFGLVPLGLLAALPFLLELLRDGVTPTRMP
jgi:hypothetical protein